MKLVYILSAIAFAISACQAQGDTETPAVTTSATSPSSTPSSATKSPIQTGSAFIEQGHSIAGKAQILAEGTQKYLILDSEFKTDSGPDLFVILHRSSPPQDYEAKNYVNLGKLQKTSGSQKYLIPANINPQDFGAVAIWCRKFNVTFGYAPLKN